MAETGNQEPSGSGTDPSATPAATPVDSSVKNWLLILHLVQFVMFLGIPLGNVIAPLVVWLIKKDEWPDIDRHGRAILNFQISMSIYAVVCIVLAFLVIGIPLLIALGIFDLVMIIKGAIKANEGVLIKYPLSIRIL
ncbi:MAG: DUF4870 domain-containing protein [bacterium]|nr:DUF4870 domain-containing protein [bacterium]